MEIARDVLRAMKKHGYDEKLAIGITLASASIGPILPPSIPLVMFGIIAQVSITQLFLGGFPALTRLSSEG